MNNIKYLLDSQVIKSNINKIKERVPGKKIIAVLKADGYGLGAREISTIVDKNIDMYAVSTIEEYLDIDSDKDILFMSPLCSKDVIRFAETTTNAIITIDNMETIKWLNPSVKYRIHICVDTTNHRIGLRTNDIKSVLKIIKEYHPLSSIEGVYTHFHNTSDKEETLSQIKCFKKLIESTPALADKITHCVASSILNDNKLLDQCCFSNAIRVGNAIYGYSGSCFGTKIAHSLVAKVLQKHTAEKGEVVGFGADYIPVKSTTVIGVLNIGHFYGIGLDRTPYSTVNTLKMTAKNILKKSEYIYTIKGNQTIRIIGRVNMNSVIVDITNQPDIEWLGIKTSTILADSSIYKEII